MMWFVVSSIMSNMLVMLNVAKQVPVSDHQRTGVFKPGDLLQLNVTDIRQA